MGLEKPASATFESNVLQSFRTVTLESESAVQWAANIGTSSLNVLAKKRFVVKLELFVSANLATGFEMRAT